MIDSQQSGRRVRLGWTRAETDIGDAYYQRFGFSFFFNYRPNER